MKLPKAASKLKKLALAGAAVGVLAAVACSSQPAAPAEIDEAQLRSIVSEAVQQSAQAPQPQVSAAEIQSMVEASMSSAMSDMSSSQVSAAEIRSMVQSAVAGAAPEGATPEQIQSMVESAVKAATADAVTGEDVQSAISMAVSEAQSGMITSADVQAAVAKATEGSLTAAQVQAIVDRAVATPEAAMMTGDEPQQGGTIRFGMIAFNSLDPMLAGLAQAEAPYGELTHDSIVMYWYDGEVTPWAVESWTSSDDLSEYTFKVRDGITFHDGSPLTSADIKWTLDRVRDEDSASPHRDNIGYIDTITTPDKNTLVLDLGENNNAFIMGDMTDYHMRVVPDGRTTEEIGLSELGSGPYTLDMESHNPTERSVMDRYPDYWRENRPYADRMVFFYMPEAVARIEALKTGAIDAILSPPLSALGQLAGNPDIRIADAPTAGVGVIDMHTSYTHLQGDEETFGQFQGLDDSIFADKNLRKALQYAVDRDFVVEAAFFGRGSPANDHPVGINDQYYWDDQPIIKQDAERAKQYLAAAGYANGVDLTLNTSDFNQMQDVALAFKESVSKIGTRSDGETPLINVDVASHDESAYWTAQWMNPCCPFVSSNWGGRPANAAINVQLRSGGVWNESFYNNPRLDELLDLAAGEADFETRKEYFREMQEILIEDVPVLYLTYNPVIYAYRSNINNVQAHPALAHWLFEEWWVSDN